MDCYWCKQGWPRVGTGSFPRAFNAALTAIRCFECRAYRSANVARLAMWHVEDPGVAFMLEELREVRLDEELAGHVAQWIAHAHPPRETVEAFFALARLGADTEGLRVFWRANDMRRGGGRAPP